MVSTTIHDTKPHCSMILFSTPHCRMVLFVTPHHYQNPDMSRNLQVQLSTATNRMRITVPGSVSAKNKLQAYCRHNLRWLHDKGDKGSRVQESWEDLLSTNQKPTYNFRTQGHRKE